MRSEGKPVANGVVGLFTGVFGGMIGLGGAEFRLPWLSGRLGLSPIQAVPMNLAISLATLLAALPARSTTVPVAAGMDHLPAVLGLMTGAVVAAFFAAGWARRLPRRVFGLAILFLLLSLGGILLVESVLTLQPVGLVPQDPVLRFLAGAGLGAGIGVISSLLGVAGGEIIIPILVVVFAVDIKLAGSLSLIISLPVVLVGLGRYCASGALRDGAQVKSILLPMAAGSIAGAMIGGLLVGLVPGGILKGGLGLILIASAWKAYRHAGEHPSRGAKATRVSAHAPSPGTQPV